MSLPRRFGVHAVTLAAASFALACSDTTDPTPLPVVASIGIAGLPDSAGVGDTLHATAQPRDGADAALTTVATRWRSLTPAIATVDSAGMIVVRDVGEARLVVSAFGRTTVEDTVTLRTALLPSRVTLSGVAATLALGARDTASAQVQDGRGGALATPVRWSASDPWVLTVDSMSGVVTAHGAGTAWVRASAGRASDSVRVEVPLVPLMPGRSWTQVASTTLSGPFELCALDATGEVWCRQNGIAGRVPGATRLRELHGGQSQYCGLDAEGRVHCVGSDGTRTFGAIPPYPTRVDSLYPGGGGHRYLRYDLGDHHAACGIRAADSVVYCWGHNDFGQTGRVPFQSADSVVGPITGSLKATQLDLTGFSGCAMALDTSVWCWGAPWYYGWASDASTGQNSLPIQVQPPGRFVSIATNDNAVCGLAADGTASCWGSYVGSGTPKETPRPLAGNLRFTQLVARDSDTEFCGITATGALHCWEVRDFNSSSAMTPNAVLPGRTVTFVSLGRYQRCAVVTGGDAFCF